MKRKSVVLLSGGMDSAYCLHWAKREFGGTFAVFVDYGQRHYAHECEAAHRIAYAASVPLSLYEMRVSWNATLCALSRPLRTGTDEDGISNAFVPGRNLHLLTVASSRARDVGAETVVIGCCANDASVFPDCRVEFLRAAGSALGLAFARVIRVAAPAIRMSKLDILRQAQKDAATWSAIQESWSCYTPSSSGAPCGECDACAHRNKAFTDLTSDRA